MAIISSTLPSGWNDELKQIRPYVLSAMAKSPLHEDEHRFISVLNGELQAYHSMRRKSIGTPTPHIPIYSILLTVRDLIEKKRSTHTPITRNHVIDQISLCGQYAILSHRWYQDNEELSFVDVPNLSHPTVQAKKGYQKLVGFSKIVQSYYGCRYLWVDSACISETDRKASIPLMFAWYRHAYVCVIYLTSPSTISKDPWSTRGWTLQELLAAERIICFTSDWRPVKDYSQGTPLFHACRDDDTSRRAISLVLNECLSVTGNIDWAAYEPGVDQAIHLFRAMGTRETTVPEDMVYSILAALNIDVPIKYGEGFDKAFYRLQAKYLTETQDRRLLAWSGDISSPYNSMLAGNYTIPEIPAWYDPQITYPDTISAPTYTSIRTVRCESWLVFINSTLHHPSHIFSPLWEKIPRPEHMSAFCYVIIGPSEYIKG
ncbi:heterokaryon incompatibility protein-domain-containing protein [Salix suchowensis]|nr:heterokaryon incompatibility protein-domain-containing protein [Salix suchowensis]